MPSTVTPVSAWTTPLQTPAGSDVANAASVENAVQKLANRIEFLKDKALGTTTWPQVGQVQKVSLIDGKPDDELTTWGLTGGVSTKQWVSDGTTGNGLLLFGLDAYLRSGQTITGYDAIVDPSNARSSTNRMSVALYYIAHDILTPTNEPVAPTLIGSISYDDTTANKQRIDGGTLSHVVDKTINEYFLVVKSGNTTIGIDRLYCVQIIVTNPGPRSL